MKAKDYLLQAKYLDQQIQSKLNEIERLNSLATNMNSVISDMPKARGNSTSRLEDTVVKIVEYENEIQADLDQLFTLKREINETIGRLSDVEYRLVLQKRYLELCTWEEISADIDKKVRWVQVIHGRALEDLQRMLDENNISSENA